jgi:hypothetical protein
MFKKIERPVMTKRDFLIFGIAMGILLVGIGIGYPLFHRKAVEYKPDPIVNVLQAENKLQKDSIASLKSEVVRLDSSYQAKSMLYVITKKYYDELKKKYGAANSDADNALLEQLLQGAK